MKNKITVIGSGAMATAIAKVAYDSGNKNITIYGIDANELEELSRGFNTKYFPNSIELPEFHTTNDIGEALEGAEYIVLAVPSKAMSNAISKITANLTNEALLINVAKGFFPGTTKSLHEGIKEVTKENKLIRGIVSLIGPSHAEEIVTKTPTVICVVDKDKSLALEVQEIFNSDYFRTYIQTDVAGAEVGAAYKNVLAIASGMAEGLGYGINTKAALLTRGLAEMQRFNKAMKGKNDTIMGLTGVGDLIVTAMSPLSRNFTFGFEMAKNPKNALKTNKTVEGLIALEFIHQIGKEKNLELPIVEFLFDVIHKGKDMHDVVKAM